MTQAPERCPWCGADPLYIRYHDDEWGVPQISSQALFEKIILEGFQAGLSWITILRKREHFRRVFDGFDAGKMVRYGPEKLAALMADPGIVRNRLKIEAARDNAAAYLKISAETDFARFLWDFSDGEAKQNRFASPAQVSARTPLSQTISKEMKRRGFRFVGPTTIYAMMQATGMVNDHMTGCHRHEICASLRRPFELSR